MSSQKEDFFTSCEHHFAFLSQYGFKRPKKEFSSILFEWSIHNSKAGLIVVLERRDQVIDAELIRVVDGKVPGRFGNTEHYYPLRTLAKMQSGSRIYDTENLSDALQPTDIWRIVGEYSSIVKELGVKALTGDFNGLTSRKMLDPKAMV